MAWLAFVLTVATAACADEPQKWLERMNQALMTLNYDGVFSHIQGGRVETLRIIHRVQDGTVTERLVSLDGSGREFIRTGSQLLCYLPDERTVLVERQPQPSLLLGSLPRFDAATSEFYDIRSSRRTRLIGRKTRLIVVDPKDDYRYGYRLWIDEQTGMPLRTQLCDGKGRVIEQVVFASIATPAAIPDAAFKPGLSTAGFRWLREVAAPGRPSPSGYSFSALRLPPGFHISVRAAQVMPGATGLVEHLVYTDGVASVSVFVESHMHAGHTLSGSLQLGSTSTFATVIDGHPVTVVGEVPPQTVKFIANSMKGQPPPR
ncbi:MAG TPA: MucB/RseB C-terminal domain-containing protein [Steroidobacteraceae bacterium]|nr:MucB/RseB C-terminal domain-containing protein [Steroidobacteraceae bacterium]